MENETGNEMVNKMEDKIENEMKLEKKKGKGPIVVIIILIILIMALGAYIVYDKVYSNMTKCDTEEVSKEKDSDKDKEESEKDTEKEPVKEETVKPNTVETRQCVGVYSGDAPIYGAVSTKENINGLLTIELKSDGTYELKKDNNGQAAGEYTIIEDTLLLKTGPDTCGPGQDCSPHYSQFLKISDDCSSISWGYGSYFFDPNFTIYKTN